MATGPGPRHPALTFEDIGGVTIATFTVPELLQEQDVRAVGEQLFHLVDELGRRKLLLDFGDVEHMSSAVLGTLVTLHQKVQAAGGRLVLCAIDPQIREVFAITRLEKVFVIRRDQQEALQAF